MVVIGVIFIVSVTLNWLFWSRWGYRTYVSDLESSIPSYYAVRADPRSELCPEFALGQMNGKGMPYSVRLFIDEANLYIVHRGRAVAFLGYPSFVIPRSEVVSAVAEHNHATLSLKSGQVRLERYSGVDPWMAISGGPSAVDEAEVERILASTITKDPVHLSHAFNALRVLAALVLLAFGVSAAAAGHWEVLLGFALGGGAVLGLLGNAVARATIDPEAPGSFAKTSSSTLAIAGLLSALPLGIAGVVMLALNLGSFFLFLGAVALSASFSILGIYAGLMISKPGRHPQSNAAARQKP